MVDYNEEKLLKEFGKKLQKLRKARKISYRKFAIEADLSVSFIQKLESGRSNPSLSTLLKIAETLGVDLNEFAP